MAELIGQHREDHTFKWTRGDYNFLLNVLKIIVERQNHMANDIASIKASFEKLMQDTTEQTARKINEAVAVAVKTVTDAQQVAVDAIQAEIDAADKAATADLTPVSTTAETPAV